MAVPSWIWFVEPVLKALQQASGPVARRDLVDSVPGTMDLTEQDLRESLGNGRLSKAADRTGWALSYANLAGLVHSPKRAHWELSPAGRELLAKYPSGLPESELQEIRRARERERSRVVEEGVEAPVVESRAVALPGSELDPVVASDSAATPDERLRRAHAELHESVSEELLDLIQTSRPQFFELLVLDVLHAMGFGLDRTSLSPTTGGADGGIDGVISLDRLGLQKVYVQAKRYAEDNPVGRPAIQAFVGALAGRRATKGVFLTSGRFTREAREYAALASDTLVLVDGQQLTALMIEHRVGVAERERFVVVSVDSDYFESA